MLKRHSGDRFEALVAEVADCTSQNMHTESLIAIAGYFAAVDHSGDSYMHSEWFKDMEAKLRRNLTSHLSAGSLTPTLHKDRRELYVQLLSKVKILVTDDEYIQLHQSL